MIKKLVMVKIIILHIDLATLKKILKIFGLRQFGKGLIIILYSKGYDSVSVTRIQDILYSKAFLSSDLS